MRMWPESPGYMSDRALLTEREAEVLSGEADDIENLAQYQSKVRHRLARRIDRLEREYELIQEHEPEIAEDIQERICGGYDERLRELERRMDEIE